ncbi:MAG: class D sortase [Anaerolineae bacterium]|nr:class D sortase [Anaerolineae bacterium]
MARQKTFDDLSTEDLRYLLLERKRAERKARLGRFARTGRVEYVVRPPRRRSGAVQSIAFEPTAQLEETEEKHKPQRKPWVDRMLFLVEIIAVLGLIFVLGNGVKMLREINREAAAAMAQPTLTPTALIMAVVLPSGHTPPNSPGGVQPNEAEIPEHLRPLVQTLANLPIPTPSPEQAVRIQIPAIGVDAPVVQGDGWEQLKKGVGQHIGSADPGKNGNLVLSAHNDVFGEIFRDLDRLKEGDQVVIYSNQRAFRYIVQQVQVVEPTRVEVMAPTREPVVTLISCYPYMVNNQRIVVTAALEQ